MAVAYTLPPWPPQAWDAWGRDRGQRAAASRGRGKRLGRIRIGGGGAL